MSNLDGVKLIPLTNIRYQTLKLTNNRRVSVGKADSGDFSIKIRRLREQEEIHGEDWKDKIAEVCFCISPEAFTALYHLSFEHYRTDPTLLNSILRNNLL
jgi:hypothetical protein